MKTTDYKIGDTVRIVRCMSGGHDGKTGILTGFDHDGDAQINISPDGGCIAKEIGPVDPPALETVSFEEGMRVRVVTCNDTFNEHSGIGTMKRDYIPSEGYACVELDERLCDNGTSDHCHASKIEPVEEPKPAVPENMPAPLTLDSLDSLYRGLWPSDFEEPEGKGVKHMQNTIQVGEIYEIIPHPHKTSTGRLNYIGCVNLEDRFDDGRAKYIRVLSLMDGGTIEYYEVLNAERQAFDTDQWSANTRCCSIDANKHQFLRKVTSASSIMQKVKVIAKKLLDADTRTLVEAGLLSDSLDLTDAGREAVLGFVFMANKKELAAEAKVRLQEEKEAK